MHGSKILLQKPTGIIRLFTKTLIALLAMASIFDARAQEIGSLTASPIFLRGLKVGQQFEVTLELQNFSATLIEARAIPTGSALRFSTLELRGFDGGCTVLPGPGSPLPSVFFEIRFHETQPGATQTCRLTYQVLQAPTVNQQSIQYLLADFNSSTIFSATEPRVTFGFSVFPVPALSSVSKYGLAGLLLLFGIWAIRFQRIG